MERLKIAFFEIEGKDRQYIRRSALKNHELMFFKEELNKDNIPQEIKDVDVVSTFIYSKIDKSIIKSLPKLKLITTRSTGFDHIDIKECKSRNIAVCNVPYYGENTVAEHTFALILSLSRKVHQAYIKTSRGDFSMKGLQGFDLKGKTIGVVGAGKIGLHVIRIAKGFGMDVLAYDIHKNSFLEEILGFKYTDLTTLLKKSDIVSIHTPYNKHTHHLINTDNIKLFKKGALLINTSRGGCVDTNAIIYGLKRGILAGVGLDAFEGEALIKEDQSLLYDRLKENELKTILQNNILMNDERVVITPHIAFNSREAIERILDTTIENIISFVDKKLQNMVY